MTDQSNPVINERSVETRARILGVAWSGSALGGPVGSSGPGSRGADVSMSFHYSYFDASESRRAMHLRMNEREPSTRKISRDERLSVAERELLAFIDGASELVGPDSKGYLREIWLDELACMDCMPAPSSSEWRLVTQAALRRLAMRPHDGHSSQPPASNPKEAKRSQ